jgi:hypothetical protein
VVQLLAEHSLRHGADVPRILQREIMNASRPPPTSASKSDLDAMKSTIADIQSKQRAIKEENRLKAPKMANAIDILRANGFPNARPTYINENGVVMGKPSSGAVMPRVLPLDPKYWRDVAKAEAEAREAKPKRGRATAIRKGRK